MVDIPFGMDGHIGVKLFSNMRSHLLPLPRFRRQSASSLSVHSMRYVGSLCVFFKPELLPSIRSRSIHQLPSAPSQIPPTVKAPCPTAKVHVFQSCPLPLPSSNLTLTHLISKAALTDAPNGATVATMATALSPTATPVLTSPSARPAPTRSHLPPNVSNVVLGNLHIKPWYPSFYPEEMLGGKKKVDWLYVCQWCFRYTTEVLGICGHCVCIPRGEETARKSIEGCLADV